MDQLKMVSEQAPELTSSHGDNTSTATYRAIPS